MLSVLYVMLRESKISVSARAIKFKGLLLLNIRRKHVKNFKEIENRCSKLESIYYEYFFTFHWITWNIVGSLSHDPFSVMGFFFNKESMELMILFKDTWIKFENGIPLGKFKGIDVLFQDKWHLSMKYSLESILTLGFKTLENG